MSTQSRLPAKRTLFHKPDQQAIAAANVTKFRHFVNERFNLSLPDYWALHKWSCQELNDFWIAVWDFTGIIGEREDDILFDASVPMNEYNPRLIRAKMNWAENILLAHGAARSQDRAIISLVEPDPSLSPTAPAYMDSTLLRTLSWEDLYQEVRKLAHVFKGLGIGPGDRVAAFSPSNAEAVIAALACTALGGIWTSTPSEFGVNAVLERLTQIEPTVLLTADEFRYNGKTLPIDEKLEAILEQLPTVKHVIVVGQLQTDRKSRKPFPSDLKGRSWYHYVDLLATGEKAQKEIQFHRGSAMDPVWVLYSSGSTGKPKAIVHSVGGMVLSQWMANTFHNNYKPGDSLMQFSTLGWMMWNYAVGVMGRGVTGVFYDGSPLNPRDIFFRLIDKYQISVLGTSPRYLQTLETAGYKPNEHYSLKSLHSMATAGSVLKAELYDWTHENLGRQIWINNGTGGTDICNLFLGGCPAEPTYHAELQVPALAMDLHSWSDDGESLVDVQGEMVIVKPFPNMPIGFWGDEGNKRYKAAYFEAFKKPVWTQGDWIEVHSLTGGITVYGRSDNVLNPGGVRFGSAEIYSVVEEIEEIEDCIVVAQKYDGDERVVLFVKPMQGSLTDELRTRIRNDIKSALSSRHIPAKMINIHKIPYTTNGKRLEIPVKKLVNGTPYESLNLSSAEDPELLRFFVNHPELALTPKAKL